jgi:hypothetical protein
MRRWVGYRIYGQLNQLRFDVQWRCSVLWRQPRGLHRPAHMVAIDYIAGGIMTITKTHHVETKDTLTTIQLHPGICVT